MKYFTLRELCKSVTATNKGINNSPSISEARNLESLVDNILDPIRENYKKPIVVSSGYRCVKLNKLVGGSTTSQHVTGEAVDIHSTSDTYKDNMVLFNLILSMKDKLNWDQLIYEYGNSTGPDWIHISYRKNGPNRHEVLIASKNIYTHKTEYKLYKN